MTKSIYIKFKEIKAQLDKDILNLQNLTTDCSIPFEEFKQKYGELGATLILYKAAIIIGTSDTAFANILDQLGHDLRDVLSKS
jgi:hypothetical protein